MRAVPGVPRPRSSRRRCLRRPSLPRRQRRRPSSPPEGETPCRPTTDVGAEATTVNLAVLRGVCPNPPEVRVLESGRRLASLALRTPRSRAHARRRSRSRCGSRPPGSRRSSAGEELVVVGAVHRRFFQTATGSAAKAEVEASVRRPGDPPAPRDGVASRRGRARGSRLTGPTPPARPTTRPAGRHARRWASSARSRGARPRPYDVSPASRDGPRHWRSASQPARHRGRDGRADVQRRETRPRDRRDH